VIAVSKVPLRPAQAGFFLLGVFQPKIEPLVERRVKRSGLSESMVPILEISEDSMVDKFVRFSISQTSPPFT